jgi:predicted MFS family arabinose efflux permease
VVRRQPESDWQRQQFKKTDGGTCSMPFNLLIGTRRMANEKPANSATITFSELFAKLETSRLTINHYKLITAAVLGDMLEFFDYYIIGFVLSFIVVPWKLNFAATATVLLSAGVGSLIGSFFFGYLADRIGRMPVLFLSTAAFTIPSGIMYFTPEGNWIFLSVFRFLVGFGVGGLYSVDMPLVQEFVPSRYRGAIGGVVCALIPAGTLLGSLSAAVPDVPLLDARVATLAGQAGKVRAGGQIHQLGYR